MFYAFVVFVCFFFFQAEDGIRDLTVTGVQTCALPISVARLSAPLGRLIALRRLGAGAEKELLHLPFEELARLGLDRREAIFVDEHRLMVQPARPGFLRHALVDPPAELTGIGGAIEAWGLALEEHTLHHAWHALPRSLLTCGLKPTPSRHRTATRRPGATGAP